MTLYDNPTTPHGHTDDEAAAIAAWLAVKQPTICPIGATRGVLTFAEVKAEQCRTAISIRMSAQRRAK